MFYELATNAAKYGGLASDDGKLAIAIKTSGEHVNLTWCETGAPRRPDPTRPEGFGSRLEKASLASLHGTIDRRWLEDGLEVVLQFPVGDLRR